MSTPAQYFPLASAPVAWAQPKPIARGISSYNRPVPRPPMGPPEGYPRRGAPREQGTCWNCGQKGHCSPQCPYPKREEGYTPICGNCGKEGHLPVECPNPPKPKMMVRFAQDPIKESTKGEANV